MSNVNQWLHSASLVLTRTKSSNLACELAESFSVTEYKNITGNIQKVAFQLWKKYYRQLAAVAKISKHLMGLGWLGFKGTLSLDWIVQCFTSLPTHFKHASSGYIMSEEI